MNKEYIIAGYKGIMPLDLTVIDRKYHKDIINQHNADIREYKIYQQSLHPKLKYENSILRILSQLDRDQVITEKRNHVAFLAKHKKYTINIQSRL
jgi:hypothetical protein